ncbi:phosphatidylinositol-specific phospholipase C domain-containing protein [Microbulbifer sp. JMSA008]|uniref:phosphatidylinositol-specific phospholipase C domain-containing protein n=1 Tax=Microbulbifer sp. JMSA008 TaxID=3243373 RepID=UPI00403A6EC7
MKKIIYFPLLALSLAANAEFYDPIDVDTFIVSDTYKKLRLQRDFNLKTPFSQQSFWGSHNTYNTYSHNYPWPNQGISIYDQLRMGAQFIELDLSYERSGIRLCHAVCGTVDQSLSDGLLEVKNFLDNPSFKNQVVIIYLEDRNNNVGYSDNASAELLDTINNTIGDYVYKSNGIGSIPKNLTPQNVLAQGKRVVIYKDRDVSVNGTLNNMLFTGLGHIGRSAESIANDFIPPQNPWESFKDFDFDKIQNIHRSNQANLVNLDHIGGEYNDLAAMVWSWDPLMRGNATGDSYLRAIASDGVYLNSGWNVSGNTSEKARFACTDGNTWRITAGENTFNTGETTCQNEFNEGYHFAYPRNAYENQQLINAITELFPDSTSLIVYDNQHKTGESKVINVEGSFGGTINLSEDWHDRISSLVVPSCCYITAWTEEDQGGIPQFFYGGTYNTISNGFDNAIKSFAISERGPSDPYRPPVKVWLALTVGDNQTTTTTTQAFCGQSELPVSDSLPADHTNFYNGETLLATNKARLEFSGGELNYYVCEKRVWTSPNWRPTNDSPRVVFQGDGHLVIYGSLEGGFHHPVWGSGTHGKGVTALRIDENCKLVFEDSSGVVKKILVDGSSNCSK